MVLPGFYLAYLLAARHGWLKRILHLAAATLVLVVVSFAWVMAVELTPAAARPYIGSTDGNSMLELVFGHNATDRFSMGNPIAGNLPFAADGSSNRPPSGNLPAGRQPPQDDPAANRPGGYNETGSPGLLRLFSAPLINEIGWVLPLALAGLVLAAFSPRHRAPLSEQSVSLLMWAGWLIPCMVFFSITSGIFHAYYVIMIAAPLAALVAAGAWALLCLREQSPRLALGLAALAGIGTLAYQAANLQAYPQYFGAILLAAAALLAAGLILAWRKLPQAAIFSLLLAALVTPLLWSALTTFNPNTDNMLPRSGPATVVQTNPRPNSPTNGRPDLVMQFILDNAPAQGYLLATFSANEAAPFILATGRPVLTFGGFSGNDPIVDVQELASLVEDGTIKLVLVSQGQQPGGSSRSEIRSWLAKNCAVQSLSPSGAQSTPDRQPPGNSPSQSGITLYNCGQ
jgi:4-amino-4-deoxy-L-arabinose transferase-like glycosyltransferase